MICLVSVLTESHPEPPVRSDEDRDGGFVPVERIAGDVSRGLLLICDHASNRLPDRYGTLGLPADELERHIGYDIGVEGVTRRLAAMLGVPAVMTRYSRLLIDPNRGVEDPTLVMRVSDGTVVPGNAAIDEAEIAYRKARFYAPYEDAVCDAIGEGVAIGRPPALLSIHSFTPIWRGMERPWHVGVLWDRDGRLAQPMIAGFQRDGRLVVGDNEPYTGELVGDTMNRHGTAKGLAHALIEIRQDLIADEAGIAEWAERLAGTVEPLLALPGLNDILPAANGTTGQGDGS